MFGVRVHKRNRSKVADLLQKTGGDRKLALLGQKAADFTDEIRVGAIETIRKLKNAKKLFMFVCLHYNARRSIMIEQKKMLSAFERKID